MGETSCDQNAQEYFNTQASIALGLAQQQQLQLQQHAPTTRPRPENQSMQQEYGNKEWYDDGTLEFKPPSSPSARAQVTERVYDLTGSSGASADTSQPEYSSIDL